MKSQRGVIHLALPLLFLLAVAAIVAVVLISTGIIKNPLKNIPFLSKLGQSGPKIELKKDYKNPFNKETQYVNPFETYKNPFTVNK